ncbi:MAG: DUF1573 domain-containing protein [Verrucomicrobiota bacterium]
MKIEISKRDVLYFKPMQRLSFILAIMAIVGLAGVAHAQTPTNALAWDQIHKEVRPEAGATNALCTFYATNITSSEVLITGTRTSCGCTVAQLPTTPYRLGPGSNVAITVTMDIRGKFGIITKTITVDTSVGQIVLILSAKIADPNSPVARMTPELRARNQQMSQQDRQAVFKGDCAVCHVTPTIGKLGGELFNNACGVCHTAEHRASMVPDLRVPKRPAEREYWADWIMHGKTGSLMPGFSQVHGGPLSDEQIFSLVEYMVGPFQSSTAPK